MKTTTNRFTAHALNQDAPLFGKLKEIPYWLPLREAQERTGFLLNVQIRYGRQRTYDLYTHAPSSKKYTIQSLLVCTDLSELISFIKTMTAQDVPFLETK
jgi:hypothetical protein